MLAIVSNTPGTPEGRRRTANEIRNTVKGSSKDSNVWYIGVLLDPENSGLRDYVQSAMTYARIEDSNEEFLSYQARLHLSLEELAEEFRRERQAIVKGKPLESLIRERKTKLDKASQQFADALRAVKAFAKGEGGLEPTLAKLRSSGVRDATLQLVLNISAADDDQQTLTRLEEVRHKCLERGWLSEKQE